MPRPKSWGAGFDGNGGRAARLPADLATPIATTGDGRDITRAWVGELEQPRDPRLLASIDWGIYERILMDDQVKSCMEQRIRAVVSRDWSVVSGEEGDPHADHAAERMEAQLRRIGWDQRTERMLWAVFYGCSVAEALWAPRRDKGLIEHQWDALRVRHARRFRYDVDGRLRLLTRGNMSGIVLPERKFWVVTSGGTNDDEPYGRGLAEWLYFPTLFKRNGVRFWNIFLDKFSVPTAKGTYPRGSTKGDIDKLLAAMMAIANDSGFAIPEGMQVDLLHLAQSGADFGAVCRYMDGAIAKVVLSQTMTTDNGSSRSQGEVHADVKLEIIKADADLLADSFNGGPSRWWTDLNYGVGVAAPIVTRIVEEEDDLKAAADTDRTLYDLGWRRTEESMQDRYGDGYERRPDIKPVVPPESVDAPPAADADDDGKVVPIKRATDFAASDPRPLYVYRRVRDTAPLVAWAREQGLRTMLPAADLHVTVTYSRHAVDWFAVAGDWQPQGDLRIEGGPRTIGRLGKAVVLHFAAGDLTWRNRQMREAGASWDYADYHPHITLTYDSDIDPATIVPYSGPIVLGPEIFEPLDTEWHEEVQEVSFAEPAHPRDVVDDGLDAIMADEGYALDVAAMIDPLLARLRVADGPDAVAAILAEQAGVDTTAFAERLARANFAIRIDALTDDAGER